MLKKALAIASITLASTSVVQAENVFNPEDAVEYRQAIYQIFSAQAGVIGGMVKGKIPFDAAEINKRANNIGKVAPMLGETYFPETRGVDDSNLKDAAWKNMEDFKGKGQAFGKALGELITASADPSFDLKAAKQTAGAMFKTCKSCHEDYREK